VTTMTTSTLIPAATVSINQMMIQSTGALLIIIILLFALRKILKRLPNRYRQKRGQRLLIIDSLALGPRERVVVAKIGDQHILLGVTAQSIQFLCQVEEPCAQPNNPPAPLSSDFAQMLTKFCVRKFK